VQTDFTLEQAIGQTQSLMISYVGALGRKLLDTRQFFIGSINPLFNILFQNGNGITSDYNSLQIRYQRRLSRGAQALASYTLSHCIDFGSEDSSLPYERGNCDFDVRHSFSGALSYNLPSVKRNRLEKAILSDWGLDVRLTIRSAFPVTLLGNSYIDPATGQFQYLGLNTVAGAPLYVYGGQYPGGRAINVNAFSYGPEDALGDAPRNFARGFGAWQMDLALRREIPEGLKLQFRAEAFNVFNHPNFGNMNANYAPASPTFGVATATLAQSLGGLSPLYQAGGARSLQFGLRLFY
jgi:hypothetical protein